MMQWLIMYEQQDLYSEIKDFLNEDLRDVTKCVWFIKSDEEDFLYNRGVLYEAGDCTALNTSSYKALKDNIDLIEQQYKKDHFSFNDYSFDALEFILSKYYGSYVRVRKA